MKNTQQNIDKTENNVLHTYNRFPIVLEKGEGVYLYDVDGKEYLDFGSGIGVMGLGYHYQGFDEALKGQIDKLTHTSNLFYSDSLADTAQKLVAASEMDKVFFTNSGAEAVEGAIKAARKYAYNKDGRTDHEIIAMNQSFHGRSMGALSVTGNPSYQKAFKPLMGGVKFADFNKIDSVKSQINERTCAIILEVVQGEGGIYPAEPAFLKEIKEICESQDILLIFDEIQCGMGRTGELFAWQQYGIAPDIMTCAKALGGGIPVGAFLLNEKAAKSSLVPGDHGTTYGGNPLALAAVGTILNIFEEDEIVKHVQKMTPYLEKKLDTLIEKYDFLVQRRGMGFMQGLIVKDKAVGEIIKNCQAQGLIILSAGTDVLRLLPPLIITETHIDEMIIKLEQSFLGEK